MNFVFKKKYDALSDKEIVSLITGAEYHDEEAATYLLWDRYSPLMHKLHFNFIKNLQTYDESVEDFYVYLRGEDGQWRKLREFQWRCRFCYWFKTTSRNFFLSLSKKLIDSPKVAFSIDVNNDSTCVKVADVDIERNYRKAILMEAIMKLEDLDQKFVVLKRLQGYNSKEIAILMQQMWDKHGIVRIDKGKVVVPTDGYVDNHMTRAKKELRKIIGTID